MCRNIKPLYNFAPVATNDEIKNASLQFVRKVSGYSKPSKANEDAYNKAVEDVSKAVNELLDSLVTTAPPKSREILIERAKINAIKRFGTTFLEKVE